MPGYVMEGPADTVFSIFDPSSRKWNFSAIPQCQGISCALPSSPANGYVSFSDDDDGGGDTGEGNLVYPVGAVGVYGCNDGYQLAGGSTTTTCTMDGSWSAVPPTCQEYCPQVSNSSTTTNITEGRCFNVFSTENTWMGAREDCVNLNGSLAVIDTNETLEVLQNLLNSMNESYTADYWIGGYSKPENYSWKWHTSGDAITTFFWDDMEPTNGDKDTRILLSRHSGFKWTAFTYDSNQDDNEGLGYVCQFNSSCTEAMITGDVFNYNGACYYFQNDGYFTWESANRAAGDSGRPGCPGLGNNLGFLAEIRDQSTQDAIVNEINDLGAVRSYWIGAEREDLDEVRKWLWVDGSAVEDTWWGPDEPNFDTNCISLLPFNDTYLMNGDDCSNTNRFVCQFDNFNTSVKCGDPGSPYHGSRATNVETFIPGDEVGFSCDPGYDIVGSAVLHCGSDGEWNSSMPSCRAKPCRSPPDVQNSFIIYQSSSEYRGTIIYQCLDDYYIIGQQCIYCQDNGNWTTPEFECKVSDSGDPACEKRSGLLIAIGTLVLIMLAYSVAMTVAYFRKKPSEEPSKKRDFTHDDRRPETWIGPGQQNQAYQELQTGNLETFPATPPTQLHAHTLPYAGRHSYLNSGHAAPSTVAYTNQRMVDQVVRMATAAGSRDHVDDAEDDYVVLPE